MSMISMAGFSEDNVFPGDLTSDFPDPEFDWERFVRDKYRGLCANCGGDDKPRPKLIVPLEAGGQLIESNSTYLCRPCDMASEAVSRPHSLQDKRPVNFWVSSDLYDRIKSLNSYDSMGALVRYLMTKYVLDESRFDDIEQYQVEGSDVKVNVWVENDRYETFKAMINKRGLTVTDAIKALIFMFAEKAEPLVKKN